MTVASLAASPAAATTLSVALVSAVPLAVAAALPRDEALLRRVTWWLVAFASGALLGAALLHLIPEAVHRQVDGTFAGGLVLAGFFGFFFLERHLWRHQHGSRRGRLRDLPPLASLNLVGDAVHNLVDGMVIAAAYLGDVSLGLTATLAVLLHEVPQEIGDYGILLHAGLSRSRAIAWNLASAVSAFAGAVAVLLIGTRVAGVADALVPAAAGGFLYIGAADLIPQLKGDADEGDGSAPFVPLICGVLLTALPLLLEHHG